MAILFGIVLSLIGVALVIKTEWWLQNFGTISWAEEHLGINGGSRLMYKIIGIVLIFFGFLLITGLFDSFLGGTLGRIFVRP